MIDVAYYKRYISKVLMALFLLFGGMMYVAYATDTYTLHAFGFLSGAQDMVHRNGRAVTALIYWFAAKLDLSITSFYHLSYILAILFYLGAMILLDKMTRDIIPNENTRILLCLLLIVNPFIIEYFMFVEMFAFAFAILLEVAATYALCRCFAAGKRSYWPLAIFFLLLAFMTYQASTGLFIILVMPFAYYYAIGAASSRDNSRAYVLMRYIGKLILTAITYLAAAGVYILIFKVLLHGTRTTHGAEYGSFIAILTNALQKVVYLLQTTCNILPEDSYLLFAGIALVCCMFATGWVGDKGLWLFHVICSVMVLVAAAAAPAVVGGSFVPRTAYPLGCVVGVLLFNVIVSMQNWGGRGNAISRHSADGHPGAGSIAPCYIRPVLWQDLC